MNFRNVNGWKLPDYYFLIRPQLDSLVFARSIFPTVPDAKLEAHQAIAVFFPRTFDLATKVPAKLHQYLSQCKKNGLRESKENATMQYSCKGIQIISTSKKSAKGQTKKKRKIIHRPADIIAMGSRLFLSVRYITNILQNLITEARARAWEKTHAICMLYFSGLHAQDCIN